ncbi:RNA polymerase sigma factor [Dyella lutea]|uniref:RNA polymerase sigma factor n=1 Tax=Dyella lutea TaxID=2950441 RepID=A0ABT1FH44_9GAMM|nr:sigma-70 family RNA polymerase sigma factor [Dyella lutea]MCP1375763.1 RNA polymerase sigma factor [Dyella lutea]
MSERYPYRAMDDPRATEEIARRRAQFDEAVIRFRGELLRYLLRRTRDAELAADLTQETFSRMLVYRDAPDIGSHTSLMYRIAHNLLLERQRARHRRHASQHVPLSLAEPLCADEPSAEEWADARSLEQSLRRALIALPPKRRLAFVLSRHDGLTYSQVAATMGISVKMVEKHISEALLAFRSAVEE